MAHSSKQARRIACATVARGIGGGARVAGRGRSAARGADLPWSAAAWVGRRARAVADQTPDEVVADPGVVRVGGMSPLA